MIVLCAENDRNGLSMYCIVQQYIGNSFFLLLEYIAKGHMDSRRVVRRTAHAGVSVFVIACMCLTGCATMRANKTVPVDPYITLSSATEQVQEIVFERRNLATNAYDRTTIRPGEAHMQCGGGSMNKEATLKISEGKSTEIIKKAFSISWPKNPQRRRHSKTEVVLILRTAGGEEKVVFNQSPTGAMRELYRELMMVRERCFEKVD